MTVIRPGTERDYEAIVAIGNTIYADRIQPPEAFAQPYLAERNGTVLGTLWLNRLL